MQETGQDNIQVLDCLRRFSFDFLIVEKRTFDVLVYHPYNTTYDAATSDRLHSSAHSKGDGAIE